MTFNDVTMARAYWTEFKRRICTCWTASIENVSRSIISMLDVEVMKHQNSQGWHFAYKPFFKPSSGAIPLSNFSSHAASVWRWPKAYIHRLAENSSTHKYFVTARQLFISRLWSNGMTQAAIDFGACDPYLARRCASSIAVGFLENAETATAPIAVSCTLNFHPIWERANLGRILSSAYNLYAYEFALVFGETLTPRIAWRNSGGHLYVVLRHLR